VAQGSSFVTVFGSSFFTGLTSTGFSYDSFTSDNSFFRASFVIYVPSSFFGLFLKRVHLSSSSSMSLKAFLLGLSSS
jgi:hypothetical protein